MGSLEKKGDPNGSSEERTPEVEMSDHVHPYSERLLSQDSFTDGESFDDIIPMIATLPHSIYNPEGTGTLSSIFIIVNAALGAGILNFSKAFSDAGGIGPALTVQAILVLFIVAALVILAHSSDRCHGGASTIQETMEGATGRMGRAATSFCVVVYCFGTTITFLIIIGDQFDRALASLYEQDFCNLWYMSRTFTMSASAIVFILPMCYSKKIDFLRVPSALGVLAILYLVGLIVYEYYAGDFTPGRIRTKPDRWMDVFLVIPDICFGYQCHVSVIPVYSCMRHRTLKHFSIASVSAIVVCVACYSLSATFGYLTFGARVDEDIMLSYSAKKPEVLAGIVALTLKTVTTYPILLFCGREATKSLLSECYTLLLPVEEFPTDSATTRSEIPVTSGQRAGFPEGSRTELIVRFVIVSVWFALSLLLAIQIPNIGEVIRMLGSLAAIFIFVFPGLCLFQFTLKSDPSFVLLKSRFRIVSSFVFTGLGFFIFGVVFTQSIQGILEPHVGPELYDSPGLRIRRETCEKSGTVMPESSLFL